MVKVGDIVRIMLMPPEDRHYGSAFPPEMDEYCGKVGRVVRIVCTDEDEDGGMWFETDIDDEEYTWCEEFVTILNQKSE